MGECSNDATIYNNQGIFFAIFCFNGVVGNLFGICLLQDGKSRIVLYAIMTGFAIYSTFLMFCKLLIYELLIIGLPKPAFETKPVELESICKVCVTFNQMSLNQYVGHCTESILCNKAYIFQERTMLPAIWRLSRSKSFFLIIFLTTTPSSKLHITCLCYLTSPEKAGLARTTDAVKMLTWRRIGRLA